MKKVLRLENLDCANCAAKIENALQGLDGVVSASVSFICSKLSLEIEDDKFDEVLEKAEKLIKKVDADVTLLK